MSVSASLFTDKQLLALTVIGGAVVLGGGYLVYRTVGSAAGAVKDAVVEGSKYVNPVESKNVINQLHEWGWQTLTGQDHGGIGIWLADVFHPTTTAVGPL